MAKQGEIEYLAKIGEAGVRHAIHKPFSDADCPAYLMQMGAVMALLPPPPARLLDVGCGTGWTSRFFARRGYEVVGVDIAPDMIRHADEARAGEGLDRLRFVVSDYEAMRFDAEFDAAVFYDALHHAVDEAAALAAVHRALKPGGVCVTSEPGVGHERNPTSREAVAKYGVTERDMPPRTIIAAGKKVGFTAFKVYPHASELAGAVYHHRGRQPHKPSRKYAWVRKLAGLKSVARFLLGGSDRSGIVVLTK